MKKNIGKTGRIVRFAVALVLLSAAFYWRSWLLFLLALFVFFEVIASWCLFCQILGKNSCDHQNDDKE